MAYYTTGKLGCHSWEVALHPTGKGLFLVDRTRFGSPSNGEIRPVVSFNIDTATTFVHLAKPRRPETLFVAASHVALGPRRLRSMVRGLLVV